MKQIKNNYIKENKAEEQRSFEFREYPQLHEYYTKQMSSGKKPEKIILTEIYNSTPKSNMFQKNESYKYYSQSTPYINNLEKYRNFSQKQLFSKEGMYYGDHFNNFNSNGNRFYTAKKKFTYYDNSDLRNDYSPPADMRVNIRKKVVSASNSPKGYGNISIGEDENLIENFGYYEINNVRNNSNNKYDSITRVIGYSNLIPLHTHKMIHNRSNVDIVKKGIFNKKEEHNYLTKKVEQNYIKKKETVQQQTQIQKKEFKKPAPVTNIKKQEIVKKYEVQKKQEIKPKIEIQKKPEIRPKIDYRKYEKKKEETVKKDVKLETKKKIEVQKVQKVENKELKKKEIKEVKEPIIIKRKENIKEVFSKRSGRYSYKDNIENDIINSRKNYNSNSKEKNINRVEIVETNSKSVNKTETKNKTTLNNIKKDYSIKKKEPPKTEVKKTEIIKKEIKTTTSTVKKPEIKPKINKDNTYLMKKIDISTTNYKKKVDEKKNIQPQKPNKIEIKNKSINIKTESYGKIDENLYRANRDINDFQKLINIKEINKMYEMKKKKNKTPKMKTKKINLGDNYKYYERKYMQSPDENYYTIHQRRNQRVIYGEQIIESNEFNEIKAFKSKPYITEESYNKHMINIPYYEENEDYRKYNNNFGRPNMKGMYNNENREEYYFERGGSYYY